MGLIRHFIRVFIRSHFRPIRPKTARQGEIISSVIYFIAAWSSVGAAVHYYVTTETPYDNSPYVKGAAFTEYDAIERFGSESENTIIRIKGFNKIEKEVVTWEEAIEKRKAASAPTPIAN